MENIENNLREKVLNLMGLSKKAGLLKIGYDQLVIGLKNNSIDIVLIAKENVNLNRFVLKKERETKVLFNENFSEEEIGRAIGYKKVLCVAFMRSKLSQSLNQVIDQESGNDLLSLLPDNSDNPESLTESINDGKVKNTWLLKSIISGLAAISHTKLLLN